MPFELGDHICWGGDSRFKRTSEVFVTCWNNAFSYRNNKSGLVSWWGTITKLCTYPARIILQLMLFLELPTVLSCRRYRFHKPLFRRTSANWLVQTHTLFESERPQRNSGHPYSWRDGIVCYNNQVVIPPTSPSIKQLLHEHHDTSIGGHASVLRTFKRLARQFYWPLMHKVVDAYVSQCDMCQRAKA